MVTSPALASVTRKDWMGLLRLAGPDARSWLQGMVTNDVERLGVGEGCYAGHLTPQGKLVAQLLVLADAEGFLLLVEAAAVAHLASVFDRLIVMEDVQVSNCSASHAVLEVFGSASESALARWAGRPVSLDRPYAHCRVGEHTLVRGEVGYEILTPVDAVGATLTALADAGAAQADRQAWDVARVEAGAPLYGVDVDDSTLLPELGGRGISYDKGCYIGQEVVARIKYLGHVNRRFVGLVCEGAATPAVKCAIRRQEKDVGYVTSAVFSPRMGRPIALGFVSRVAATPGTDVILDSPTGAIPARIVELPFKPDV
jgi:folate-binding protein YgfZ